MQEGGFFGLFSELGKCCAAPTFSVDQSALQTEEEGGKVRPEPAFHDGERRGIESIYTLGRGVRSPLAANRVEVPQFENPHLCAVDCSSFTKEILDFSKESPSMESRTGISRSPSLSLNTYLFSLASSGSAAQLRTHLRKADARGNRIVDCDFQVPPDLEIRDWGSGIKV